MWDFNTPPQAHEQTTRTLAWTNAGSIIIEITTHSQASDWIFGKWTNMSGSLKYLR